MASKPRSHFPETRWSLIKNAASSEEHIREEAVDNLLNIYLPALRTYLLNARRIPAQDADDYLHDFFTDKIFLANLIERASSDRGKLRNLLVKALNNYIVSKLRKENSNGPKIIEIDQQQIDNISDRSIVENEFDQYWARHVIQLTLCAMETECQEKDRLDIWDVFKHRIVEPAMNDQKPIAYDELVDRFNLSSPRKVINLLVTGKRMFVRNIHAEIVNYLGNEEEVANEISDLQLIVSKFMGKESANRNE